MGEDVLQGGADAGELGLVGGRKPFQGSLAVGGQADLNPAPVGGIVCLDHQAVGFHPGDQADGAVMPDFEKGGEFPDGESAVRWEAADDEHGLVLLRAHPGDARGVLAEMKKFAQLVAKGRQMRVIGPGDGGPRLAGGTLRHKQLTYIAVRYYVKSKTKLFFASRLLAAIVSHDNP